MTASICGLFFEQGKDEGEDVAGDDLVAPGGGVGAVALHHSGDAVNVFEQEGKHGDAVLLCQQGVGLVELKDVVGAVVGRQRDAGEGYPGAGAPERGDDLVQICAGVCDGQAAQAVVATELDDDDGGMEGENLGQALDAVLGGVAADALIVDAVVDVEAVEGGLQVVGVALSGIDAGAGGQAVAEADEQGAVVVGLEFGLGVRGDCQQETRQDRERINFPHRSNVSKIRMHGWECLRIIDVTQRESLVRE